MYSHNMRISKKTAAEALRTVEGGERFFNADGSAFASLRELAERVGAMPQDVFNHHCSSQKCDFAAWIEDILHDATLAKTLRAAKGVRSKIEKALRERVAQLEAYL